MFKKDTMTDIRNLALAHTPLLENYHLAPNPQEYVQTQVNLPQDSHFFHLLLDPSSEKDEEYAKSLGLSKVSEKEIAMAKLWREVRQAETTQAKKDLIKKMKNWHPQIKFDFPKPAQFTEIANENLENTNKSQSNNRLKTEETVREVVIRAVKENAHNFMKLSSYGLKNFPLQQLRQNKQVQELQFGFLVQNKDVIRSLPPEEVADLMAHMISKAMESKQSSQEEEFPEEFHHLMTTEQILALKKRLPNLFKGYSFYREQFRQNYEQKLRKYKPIDELSFEQKEEKRIVCSEIIQALRKEGNDYSWHFIEKLTEEVLLLSESIFDCNMEVFLEYLSNIRSSNYENLSPEYKEKIKEKYGKNKLIGKSHESLSYLDSQRVSQGELIGKIVHGLLRNQTEGTVDKLSKFLSRTHLLREEAKVKLSKGKLAAVTNLYELFTADQINELKQQKKLTFNSSNKSQFLIDESVHLSLKIKNIRTVTTKIFAIDLQKQYLQSNSDINQDINLKFLVPMEDKKYECGTTDPFKEEELCIDLKELDGRLGMFIVQLEAQGITSRAVIRKGTIVVRSKIIPVGHELTFFDEKGQRIERLDIWRDDKKIDVEGSFIIPFGSQGSQNLIICYKGYAQRQRVRIMQEQYSLSVDYLYHGESFLVGHQAKILLHCQLNLGEQPVSLGRLSKTDMKVTMVNNQGISHIIPFDNLQLKDGQQHLLQVPVKSYISSLTVQVTTEVEKIDKTKQKLSSSKKISVDLEESHSNFVDCYLDKVKGDYILSVKGKNGEPIPNVPATFSYEQFGADFSFSATLNASEKGIFELGPLSQVKKLTASITYNGFASVRNWKINNYEESVSFGGPIFNNSYKLFLKEGEGINLPLPCQLTQDDIIFYHEHPLLGNSTNCAGQLQLSANRLLCENLKVGKYVLILLRLEKRVDLEVVKGKNWIEGDLIDEEGTIYKVRKDRNHLMLGELTAVQKEDGSLDCQVEIVSSSQTNPRDMRLQVFAKNFIDPELAGFYTCKSSKKILNDKEKLRIKGSSYYSDKRLSDETAYVLNRRLQEVTAGNNLEKPHIFLKRVEVRSTDTKDEELQMEGRFLKEKKMMKNDMLSMDSQYMMKAATPQYASYQRSYDDVLFGAGGGAGKRAVTLQRSLNSHNNFLASAGYLSANHKGSAQISIPQGYSHIIVYLFHGQTVTKREYSLPHCSLQKISMTHSALSDAEPTQGWSMSREIHQVPAGSTRSLSKNCTWTTVSRANVLEYAKIIGHKLPEWLSAWHSYSPEKKQKVYDEEFSHELNFFIYKNDQEFFQSTVRPFVSNRIKKTFVDHYLLEADDVKDYACAHRIQKLNYFERALLVERLRGLKMQKQADSLANAMELELKNERQSGEQFKKFFETILNAKKSEEKAPPPPPPPSAPAPQSSYVTGGAALFGASMNYMAPPPPPGTGFAMNECADLMGDYEQCQIMYECCEEASPYAMDSNLTKDMVRKAQNEYKPGFKETEKTRQYTDTTYEGITCQDQSATLCRASLFWAELARHNASASSKDFLSDKFWSFSQKRDFILACAVLPPQLQADYELSNSQNSYIVKARSSFLTFAREVKALPYTQSKSIVLNQRFFDPSDPYFIDEEGTQCEKEVEHFLVLKPYVLQTIITNISGSILEVQLLQDIPDGSIPLKSHEQTQISNVQVQPYSTKTFEREFYFPSEGKYQVYPANASKNRTIIAKGRPLPEIQVVKTEPITKKESLANILRSGSNEEVYSYLETKNIFDRNTFNLGLIVWKLKDEQFYQRVINIFRQRNYFDFIVWSFGLYHCDYQTACEFFERKKEGSSLGLKEMDLPIFEYYPYYSSRVHKFADEGKSTIRVKELRQNYSLFLLSAAFENKVRDATFRLAFVYYLLLQDRIADARKLFSQMEEVKGQYQLQADYIDCYLEMYSGSQTINYSRAKSLSEKYRNYPVPAWRKLFLEVYETLTKSEELDTDDSKSKAEEVIFSSTVTNSGEEIKITRAGKSKIITNFYKVDLELYFSEFPFQEVGNLSAIAPTRSVEAAGDSFEVHVLRREEYADIGDCVVEVYQYREKAAPKRISRFLWGNPAVKIKVNETEGTLKVFVNGKKSSTAYCKVYSRGSKGEKFYRDGYTDIASSFRYALDSKDISEFSLLVVTDQGGAIRKVKPPSSL